MEGLQRVVLESGVHWRAGLPSARSGDGQAIVHILEARTTMSRREIELDGVCDGGAPTFEEQLVVLDESGLARVLCLYSAQLLVLALLATKCDCVVWSL